MLVSVKGHFLIQNGNLNWLGCLLIGLKQSWWRITIITFKIAIMVAIQKQFRLMCSVHLTSHFEGRRVSWHALLRHTETKLLECYWWDRSRLLQQCILGSHSPQYLTLQDSLERKFCKRESTLVVCDTCKQSHLRNAANQSSHCNHPPRVQSCCKKLWGPTRHWTVYVVC